MGAVFVAKAYVIIGSGTNGVGQSYDTIEIIRLLIHLRIKGVYAGVIWLMALYDNDNAV